MNDEIRERLRTRTMQVILAMRAEYLVAGANPMRHWDQIQDRIRSAARQATDVPGWVTRVARSLGLGAPNNYRSSATIKLRSLVLEHDCSAAWLEMIEEEHGYLMALARHESEQRRDAREAAEAEKKQAEAEGGLFT